MINSDKIEEVLKKMAKDFTEENLNNPGESEYLLIHNAMLKAWELGVRQSIELMKEKGISITEQ